MCLTSLQRLSERKNHVVDVEGAVYKVRYRLGAGIISQWQSLL